jgi:crossover junction endodeoxyribonuclease RuvC
MRLWLNFKMRVLGVDPGLTRCGFGIVENGSSQKLIMVGVGVIKTPTDIELAMRLLALENELIACIKEYKPDVIAVERVFSQLNIRTAMATGQAAGVALLIAARSGIPVVMHTPTEVKAAVTGSGRADKKQVALMVQKLLSLKEIPKPVDATDALALAICHHWRGTGDARIATALAKEGARLKRVSKK